jgi:hypothetical protein
MRVTHLLLWLWTCVNNLVTLAWGLVVCGGDLSRAEYTDDGYLEVPVRWLPMGATGECLGRVMLYRGDDLERVRVRPHERVHGRDATLLGPLFLIAYPLAGVLAVVTGGGFYWDNFFERRARRISGVA